MPENRPRIVTVKIIGNTFTHYDENGNLVYTQQGENPSFKEFIASLRTGNVTEYRKKQNKSLADKSGNIEINNIQSGYTQFKQKVTVQDNWPQYLGKTVETIIENSTALPVFSGILDEKGEYIDQNIIKYGVIYDFPLPAFSQTKTYGVNSEGEGYITTTMEMYENVQMTNNIK